MKEHGRINGHRTYHQGPGVKQMMSVWIGFLEFLCFPLFSCFPCLFAWKKQVRERETFSPGGCNFTRASSSALFHNRFQITMIAFCGLFSTVCCEEGGKERTHSGLGGCPAWLANTFEHRSIFRTFEHRSIFRDQKTHFLRRDFNRRHRGRCGIPATNKPRSRHKERNQLQVKEMSLKSYI